MISPNDARQQKTVRGCILATGAFVFLASALVPAYQRRGKKLREADRASATVQHGEATVIAISQPGDGELGNPTGGQILVKFHGRPLAAQNFYDLAHLKLNQPAAITYRVGKTGTIYVDLVAPMPTFNP